MTDYMSDQADVCVVLEKLLRFVQVPRDEEKIVHQPHQTPAGDAVELKKQCPLVTLVCYCS